MGDNAQSIYAELAYRPMRGMLVKISYTNDVKYNSYAYLRIYRGDDGVIRDGGIGQTLGEKPFNHAIYRNNALRLDGIYEVHPNMYVTLSMEYNNAQGFDNQNASAIPSEDVGDAQHYLDTFCPSFYQGKNFTTSVAFSFGF